METLSQNKETKNIRSSDFDESSELLSYKSQQDLKNKNQLKTKTDFLNMKKDFKCEYCMKTFTQIGNLNTHLTIHSAVKQPFKCEFCGKLFSQNGNRKVHQIRCIKNKK